MEDLESEIRRRFLTRINGGWDCEDPRLDFGVKASPIFIRAFEEEIDSERRAKLLRVIWGFRDPSALMALAAALRDSVESVWKEALDGIVTLGGEDALVILREYKRVLGRSEKIKCEWIDEAEEQIVRSI